MQGWAIGGIVAIIKRQGYIESARGRTSFRQGCTPCHMRIVRCLGAHARACVLHAITEPRLHHPRVASTWSHDPSTWYIIMKRQRSLSTFFTSGSNSVDRNSENRESEGSNPERQIDSASQLLTGSTDSSNETTAQTTSTALAVADVITDPEPATSSSSAEPTRKVPRVDWKPAWKER